MVDEAERQEIVKRAEATRELLVTESSDRLGMNFYKVRGVRPASDGETPRELAIKPLSSKKGTAEHRAALLHGRSAGTRAGRRDGAFFLTLPG